MSDADVVAGQPASEVAGAARGGLWAPAGISWSLFEFARNPYYFLVVIYVFPAYFAGAVIGDAVEGQAIVAEAIRWAGIVCALTVPLLGAMMDRGGRRKPVMAVFLGLLAFCAALLWWSKPGGAGLGVAWTMVVLVVAYVCYTYSEVMHNAMLPDAGRRSSLSYISGVGLGLGQAASAIGLVVVIVLNENPALLGLDPSQFELPRGIGPATAVWLVIFVAPFFFFMPDGAPVGGSWARASRDLLLGSHGRGLGGQIKSFIVHVTGLFREHPDVMKFLVVRMIYADGVTTLLALGGVYTAGVLGWQTSEIALYGIWGSIFGVAGGFLGGTFDKLSGGPRRAIMVELAILVCGVTMAISVTQDAILFGVIPAGHEVNSLPFFSTLAEVSYLGAIAVVAVAATAIISSSRCFLVEIAPRERISEFFGLYMMAATVTVWMGPLLVEVFTRVSDDQRIGFTPVPLLLFVGMVLMLFIKPSARERELAKSRADR